jgi:hypothetical protein
MMMQSHDGDSMTLVTNPDGTPVSQSAASAVAAPSNMEQADAALSLATLTRSDGVQGGQPMVNMAAGSMAPLMYDPSHMDVNHYQSMANVMGTANMYQYPYHMDGQQGQHMLVDPNGQPYLNPQGSQVVMPVPGMQVQVQSQEPPSGDQDGSGQGQMQAPLQAQHQTIPPQQQHPMDDGSNGMPMAKMARREDDDK